MAEREPGPIAASESLLQVLAEYRQWHVLLADADPQDPLFIALRQPTELAPELVDQLETELQAGLSDATLAVLASRVPHLEDHFEMRVDNIAALAREAWKAGLSDEMLPLARSHDVYYCVLRRENPWSSTIVTPWHPEDAGVAPSPLVRWLKNGAMREFWELLTELEVVEHGADDPPPHGRTESGEGLVPRLAVPRAIVEATAVRVQHPKFGVGRVLRSTGAGEARKLDIDFGGDGGVRTILARFVTELNAR